MNTKGIKFLAVLAVMALAFAAFVALAPEEKTDAIKVFNDDDVAVDIETYTTSGYVGITTFYVSSDLTVKIKEAPTADLTFYVQNGKTLELDVKTAQTNKITIYTVTGDQELVTTSGVGTDAGVYTEGKFILEATQFQFKGEAGQSIYYKAATGSYDLSYADDKFTGKWTYTTDAMVGADKAFTATITTGNKVSVAEGQTIVLSGEGATEAPLSNLNFGLYYYDSSDDVGTYYAASNNAGTIALESGDKAVFKKGASATFNYGKSVVKATSVASGSTIEVTADSTTDELIKVTKLLKGGDLTISGKADLTNLNNNGGNVTLANKIDLVASTIGNTSGSVIVKAGDENDLGGKLTVTGAGKVILQNSKLWDTNNTTSIIFNVEGVTGLVDTTAITKVAKVKDEISTTEIATNQTFELVDDTKVYQSLRVNGILIINPGVTLTIDENANVTTVGKYAQVINNGKIVVKAKGASGEGLFINGGVLINNGTIDFNAKANSDREGPTFAVVAEAIGVENNGTITISKNDIAAIAIPEDFVNNGTLNLNGKVITSGPLNLVNKGKVVINGADVSGTVAVSLASNGASVVVSSMKMTTNGVFTVDNAGVSGTSVVGLTTAAQNTTIRGITYTASTVDSVKYIDIKGALAVSIPSTSEGKAKVALEGGVYVSGNWSIPKNANIEISTQGVALNVAGNMNVDKDSHVNGDQITELTMTVTGKVITGNDLLENCTFIAAKYVYNDIAVYTTLNEAIAEAVEADVWSILLGGVTITEDVVIPDGLTVDASESDLIVGSKTASPEVVVSAGGRLSAGSIDLVNGSIYAVESSGVDEDVIFAHVINENVIFEGDIYFESLEVALADATSGDYIKLSKDYILKSSAVTIPAGVTVDATANSGIKFILINSNMDVAGTIITDEFYFAATTNDEIGITLQGFMKDQDSRYFTPHWFTPVGVSYYETTTDYNGDEVTYFVITALDNLQQAVYDANESKVTVEGKAKLGNVTIEGTEGQPAEVTFNEDISAGTITLDNAVIIAKGGKQISATFADEYGSITIRGAYVVENKKVQIYSLGENGVYMTGPITDSDKGTYSILFQGKTGTNNAVIGWGSAVEPTVYPSVTFAGETLITGNKNIIANDQDERETNEYAGVVTISGDVIVDNSSKLTIVADVDVLGSLAAKEKTTTTTNGNVEVNGNVFLGATKASIYDGKAAIAAYGYENPEDYVATYGHPVSPVTNGVAFLAGKIIVGEDYFITKYAESLIEDSIVEDMKSADIVIDGKLWITVYGTSAYSMDGLKAPIVDCTVDKIYDVNGEEIANFSQVYGVIYGHPASDLDLMDTVYITVDYYIYTVLIKTDASIKAVYIDGVLTYTGMNQNQFVMPRVEAGTHTVSVEPATGYTADKAYLYTDLGTLLKGLKFTFNQNDCIWVEDGDNGYYEVVYNVAGTEKIVDPEPLPPEQVSEWTVTTILLLVLVILIAIMAVIVALRLNRS